MHIQKLEASEDRNPQETSEWLDSLDEVIDEGGPDRASYLLQRLNDRAAEFGVTRSAQTRHPLLNTIPVEQELPYPGDRAIERRIKSLIRWNAMAMVVRANKYDAEHRRPHFHLCLAGDADRSRASTISSTAPTTDQPGDFIYFQGHASPGCMRAPFSKAA